MNLDPEPEQRDLERGGVACGEVACGGVACGEVACGGVACGGVACGEVACGEVACGDLDDDEVTARDAAAVRARAVELERAAAGAGAGGAGLLLRAADAWLTAGEHAMAVRLLVDLVATGSAEASAARVLLLELALAERRVTDADQLVATLAAEPARPASLRAATADVLARHGRADQARSWAAPRRPAPLSERRLTPTRATSRQLDQDRTTTLSISTVHLDGGRS